MSAANRDGWTIRSIASVAEIGRQAWDSCAFPDSVHEDAATPRQPPDSRAQRPDSPHEVPESPAQAHESPHQEETHNPFISFDFLSALEESGCVGGRTGWRPAHVIVEDGTSLVAAAPCYVKTHSQGEYVFDHGWAEALERAGGRYYPKLQVAVPFTPATGPRLLMRRDVDPALATDALTLGLRSLRKSIGASGIHATFLPQAQAEALAARGFLLRNDRQFHWSNAGFRTFDGFLDTLASRKRKAIRRERKEALAAGVEIEWLTGDAISEEHWDAFFAFYMDTGSRKWGRPYLNRTFFALLGERMRSRILLIMARREGRYIAGAINFLGERTLFGRNWGAIEQHPFLHFEVCYYQAIDFAIAHGLATVEAGAQGEHKLARGYLPRLTWSAHDIAHDGLRDAVADYLERERAHVAAENSELAEFAPFRKSL